MRYCRGTFVNNARGYRGGVTKHSLVITFVRRAVYKQTLVPDVIDYSVVEQVLYAVATRDETSGHCGADLNFRTNGTHETRDYNGANEQSHLVGHPVSDQCDVSSVFAEQVRVEDELLGIRSAPCDDYDSVLAQDGLQLKGGGEDYTIHHKKHTDNSARTSSGSHRLGTLNDSRMSAPQSSLNCTGPLDCSL